MEGGLPPSDFFKEDDMREFSFADSFVLSEILDKTGLQLDINSYADAAKAKNKDSQAYLGGQLILSLLKKIHLAKNEVLKLASDMTGEDIEEVKNWNISKMKEFFKDLFSQAGFKDFFS